MMVVIAIPVTEDLSLLLASSLPRITLANTSPSYTPQACTVCLQARLADRGYLLSVVGRFCLLRVLASLSLSSLSLVSDGNEHH